MARLFGTDGIRGIAVSELTCELCMLIGRAAIATLTKSIGKKPKILIGKDTRLSSDILESSLISGVCSMGADVHILDILPTPAVALLVKKYSADLGIMISASHNTFEFNGIKIFSKTGYKVPDEIELEIERLVLDNPEELIVSDFENIGRIFYEKNAVWDYVRYLMKTVDSGLQGLRIAIDCANGSASVTAEKLFSGLGATCYLLNAVPDGLNINDYCGSTHIEGLMNFVVQKKCHCGVAFDGDADRCLCIDENGALVDGDKLLAIFANDLKSRDMLKNRTIVATVISNLGLMKFAEGMDIKVVTSKVGDRYVLESMLEGEYNLGGEQSGHIIFLDNQTTGDGQLTAIKLLDILQKTGKKMSELASVMTSYPQVMINNKISPQFKNIWQNDKEVLEHIEHFSEMLGSDGRILVRESGTEPLIRIMVEGKNFEQINNYAVEISDIIQKRSRK